MATDSVPGADPKNNDKLARGSWAEHEDGSMIYVMDIDENDRVVSNMYDFKHPAHPISYPLALPLKEFEKTFSFNPTLPKDTPTTKSKKSRAKATDDDDSVATPAPNFKWTWHDKQPMPWERVMRLIDNPVPQSANVEDTLSAAAHVAYSLRSRLTEVLDLEHVRSMQGVQERPAFKSARTLRERLRDVMDAAFSH